MFTFANLTIRRIVAVISKYLEMSMLQKVAFILVFVLECFSELMAAPMKLRVSISMKVVEDTKDSEVRLT